MQTVGLHIALCHFQVGERAGTVAHDARCIVAAGCDGHAVGSEVLDHAACAGIAYDTRVGHIALLKAHVAYRVVVAIEDAIK